MRDELGDHRIVIRRDLPARRETRIDADIGWQFHRHDPAGRRQEAAFGILGIEPRLDGVAVEADLRLLKRQLFAAGNTELPFDQIETRDRFRHRMLDLEPRVHFDEPERVGAQPFGAVGNEFDRAGADITDGARRLDCGCAHLRAQLRRHAGRRRFLDHLLVAPLQRAVALAEMNDIAVAVGEHLDFDMARRGNVFLEQDTARTERRFRLANGAFERRSRIRRACRRGAARARRRRPPA